MKQNRFILFFLLLCLFCASQAQAQTFMIPDVNFRNCLKATYPHIFNASDELIIAEAQMITRIECQSKNIQSIEGIGYFENVEFLDFANNQLQLLPALTTLTRLESLGCSGNKLTSLPDLSFNTELMHLTLSTNLITDFPDISNNLKLLSLQFHNNKIQSVPDLSAHTLLIELDISLNPLQFLPDLSANTDLLHLSITDTELSAFPDLSHNINLKTIRFGRNAQFSVFPDLSNNLKLSVIGCEQNNFTSIPDLSTLTELAFLVCYENNLTSLPDLSKNPKLRILHSSNNDLVQLPDLSKCPDLEWLYCDNNKLTTLPDLSNHTKLLILKCGGNDLTALPDLTKTRIATEASAILETFSNLLTFEDLIPVRSFPAFKSEYNAPQKKFSGNTSRTFVPGNPAIIDLDIDDAITSNVYTWYKNNVVMATTNSNVYTINNVTAADAGSYRATVTNPAVPGLVLESGIITVNVDPALQKIPDANFRACLRETYPQIFDSNGMLILSEAKKIKVIDCSGKGIESIEGIGYFENAESLTFNTNALEQIADITGLGNLYNLMCQSNQITTIPDLSGNPLLQFLDLGGNKLTTFPDLTNNPMLRRLGLMSNQITSTPDLSAFTSLEELFLGNNPLQNTPDLSANTQLRILEITNTDIPAFPDLSQNINLTQLSFGTNPQFTAFPDLSANTKLITLDCSFNNLPFIPDLSAFTDLEQFDCQDNNLVALPDLSKNLKLKYLQCGLNDLTQLPDLSKCSLLEFLDCRGNQLTSLPDLSNNTKLATMYCFDNKLVSLPDLSRTQIGRITGSHFGASSNQLTFEDLLPLVTLPNYGYLMYAPQAKISADASQTLSAGAPFTIDLNIDDNVTSNVYTWYKDNVAIGTTSSNVFTIAHVTASDAGAYRVTVTNPGAPDLTLESGVTTLTIDPSLGWIADDNFRACLKETYPWIFNSQNQVILAEVVTIKEINCNDKGIKDISGIEYFINTENVYLQQNQITDISMLPALTKVYRLSFDMNNISSLPDMSASPVLQELHFSQNNFSVFPDATANTNMKVLDFRNNHITSVPDLSAYQNLRAFSIGFNPITELPDLSDLPFLYSVEFAGTNLSTFPDLTGIEKLSSIGFGHNPQFSTWPANFPATASISDIECENNNLSVIPSLSAFPKLTYLNVSGNNLTALPGISSLTELYVLICHDNKLTSLESITSPRLTVLLTQNNELHALPDLSLTRLGSPDYTNILNISGNHLTTEDLLLVIKGKTYDEVHYVPQTIAAVDQVITKDKNESFTIDIDIDDAVTNNVYTWYKDGVQVTTTAINKLTINSVQAQHAGVYTCVITNPDLPELEINWEKLILKVNTLVPPWKPVAGGAGNHIVVIPADLAVDLHGATIQAGDYIGIFFKDDQATLQLSGSAQWNGAGTAITVWGKSDQGPKNGFAAGETMTVMIWRAADQRSYTMSATYDAQVPFTDRGNFKTNGFSKILSLKAAPVCQRIDLHIGWNLISTYITASDLSLAAIFGNRNGVIVKDASGRILYAPEFGITSGTWNVAEGYLIYSATEQFFEICGRPVNPATPISLVKNAYPAFLPYYGNVEVPVSEALQALGSNFSYAQTIMYNGGIAQAYNYIPAHVINPPIDQIGNMRPGQAYKILLQNSVPAFTYPASISNVGGRLRGDTAAIAAVHYGAVRPATANNAVLVIPDNIFGGTLAVGDELGVYSSAGELIGAVAYRGEPMAITLWEPAAPSAENHFTVRLWRAGNGTEYAVALSYAGGAEGRLIPNTLLVANAATVSQSEEFGTPVKVFPNPAGDHVQFSIHTARAGVVRIVLYDMMGRERGMLFNDVLPAGEHHQTIDLGAFTSGQYIYKVSADNRITSDKLVIVK